MDVVSCMKWLPREYAGSDFFINHITRDLEEDSDGKGSELDDISIGKTVEDDEITRLFDLDDYDNDDFYPNQQFLDISKRDERLLVEDQDEIDSRKLSEADRIIVNGYTNDDLSSIVVYIYDTDTCGLEPCHSIPISTFPLCCELILGNDFTPLVSVGTFENNIYSWNINELNNLTPTLELEVETSTLSLSQSKHVNELLASGHSDNVTRVWNLADCTELHKYTHHNDKVQSVIWDVEDPSLLITGSFDKTISLIDVRHHHPTNTITLKSDVETIDVSKHHIIVGLEDGTVYCYDKRKLDKAVWNIYSHNGPCSSLCIKNDVLVTCGLDCNANVYNINGNPKVIKSKNLKADQLFCSSYSRDDDELFSFGGSTIVIWDINY